MPERNWHEDNWELVQKIGRTETMLATHDAQIEGHDKDIARLEQNQDRIFGKLDKLSGKVFVIIGVGVAVQVLLAWILPAIKGANP